MASTATDSPAPRAIPTDKIACRHRLRPGGRRHRRRLGQPAVRRPRAVRTLPRAAPALLCRPAGARARADLVEPPAARRLVRADGHRRGDLRVVDLSGRLPRRGGTATSGPAPPPAPAPAATSAFPTSAAAPSSASCRATRCSSASSASPSPATTRWCRPSSPCCWSRRFWCRPAAGRSYRGLRGAGTPGPAFSPGRGWPRREVRRPSPATRLYGSSSMSQ